MTVIARKENRSRPAAGQPTPLDIHHAIARHVRYSLGMKWDDAGKTDLLKALSMAIKDRLTDMLVETESRYQRTGVKRLYYLSMEFLMGRSLGNNLLNLGLLDTACEALEQAGTSLEELRSLELDAALGNGGLGRLAACFLDSLATLDLPGFGYGINYEYGLFRQEIHEGRQVEKPDNWLFQGTPWLVEHPEQAVAVPLYGRLEKGLGPAGRFEVRWVDRHEVMGVPWDMPVVGWGGRTVNFLRLYSARSSTDFDMQIFGAGDYLRAVEQKIASETISKVLYPNDDVAAGRKLRLVQEYFLVSCSIQDILRRFKATRREWARLPDSVAIQLNDTHPALTVAELMHRLVDVERLPWDQAWDLTVRTLAYTNHTLLPEALETWPVALMESVMPRHLDIVYEINRRFLEEVARRWPGDQARLRRMSLIEEGEPKRVRMAHLAIVGSHSVNGVAALHSRLLATRLVPDFHELWPGKFCNKTNGVTPRRWVAKANPGLASLFTEAVGPKWVVEMERLRGLEARADEPAFQDAFLAVKRANKVRLAAKIRERCGLAVDPDSLFDVHVKRIHEYKRQLLNVLQIVHRYLECVEEGRLPEVARTYVFAGKAAPGYWAAKQIIRLIHAVGGRVNADPRLEGRMKVVFLPNYRVSLAEIIIPAADLSEQISTAGMEASGTGNMKLSMNGALTIGTLDGANIEIREEVGAENIFIFGLGAEEVERHRAEGTHDPGRLYREDHRIRRVLDALRSTIFCPSEPGLFDWVHAALVERGDPYFLLADLPTYIEAQERVSRLFLDRRAWARMAILNTARMGKFSSDRTVKDYAREIWGL